MSKTGKTISVIVGVIVVALLVQWGRFYAATKDLKDTMCIVLPGNYFPFNGAFCSLSGKIKKSLT